MLKPSQLPPVQHIAHPGPPAPEGRTPDSPTPFPWAVVTKKPQPPARLAQNKLNTTFKANQAGSPRPDNNGPATATGISADELTAPAAPAASRHPVGGLEDRMTLDERTEHGELGGGTTLQERREQADFLQRSDERRPYADRIEDHHGERLDDIDKDSGLSFRSLLGKAKAGIDKLRGRGPGGQSSIDQIKHANEMLDKHRADFPQGSQTPAQAVEDKRLETELAKQVDNSMTLFEMLAQINKRLNKIAVQTI